MPQQPATSTDRLANVIEVIQLGRKTGILTAERNAGTMLEQSMIIFVKGQVTQASAGQYTGFPAFSLLKTWGACRFAFTPSAATQTTQPLAAITGEAPTLRGFSTDPTLRARAPANHKQLRHRYRRRLLLSLRISLLLMLAAIVPLLITVAGSELRSRPALVTQANAAMQTDAQSRVQLIDTYLNERLLDAKTLTQIPSLVAFMATPPQLATQDLIVHAGYALAAGILRDKHYTIWALFDPAGHIRLYYPTTSQPTSRVRYLVPPGDVQELGSGKTFITPVYYNPKTQKAFVDIFSPIVTTTTPMPTYLGFVRATLNIDFIWNVVGTDQEANGSGSYAFILDQNGVRIADTDPSRRFTAVAPLASQVQQTISSEARYGTTGQVPVLADSTISGIGQGNHLPTTFQMTPGGQTGMYQVAQRASTMVPWTSFVLSPVTTVTAVVNQQLSDTIIIAFIVQLLAAIIGLIVGR